MSNQAGTCAGPPARGRSNRDRGVTFVELVVAVVLVGIVVIPILSAVRASIEASSRARSAAQVETMVVNAADRVNRATKSCNYASYARAAVVSQKWDEDRLLSVRHWYYRPAEPAGVGDLGQAGQWIGGGDTACELDEPSELEVQKIEITVTSPDGTATRTIEVVKSDV